MSNMNNLKKVTIYTDGACSGNPGPGGWAAVLIYNDRSKNFVGHNNNTTNNRMELTAVIAGLKALKEPCEVTVYSDSAYVVNAFKEGWFENWKKNGWCKSNGRAVENQSLWGTLGELLEVHKVEFIKVKGHNGNKYNELCDKLAVEQSKISS